MPVSPEVDLYLNRRRAHLGFAYNETYAAFALVAATVIALIWANSGSSYEHFWETETSINLGFYQFTMSYHGWVDEFLMALFFFVIGLDVRRELSIGELSVPGRMLLPVCAAVGGLIVPALIFLAFNAGSDTAHAWGSVISTDTAFALGMLALIGPKNAPRLRIFLLAIAVVDDIGALLVIAIAYTGGLNFIALGVAALGLIGIYLLQRNGVWRLTPYLVLGLIVWFAVFQSGVHATIAGVLIALLMPVYNVRRQDVGFVSELYNLFRQSPSPISAQVLRESLVYTIPLNQRISAVLPPYVSYIIVPLFALANAGIVLSPQMLQDAAGSTLTWGIIAGLVLGKLIGVVGGSMIAIKISPRAKLPGLDLPRILGIGALTGMGFTISLLVVGLALDDVELQAEARIGVLAASLLALALATVIFRLGDRFAPLPPPDGMHLPRDVDPESDHIFGDPNAPITLVVYAAMNPRYREGLARAIRDAAGPLIDRGEVKVVFRHKIDDQSEMPAALALEAAGRQGKFCQMHDELVLSRDEPTEDNILDAAGKLGLDVDKLRTRIDQVADEASVADDAIDAIEADSPDAVLYLQGERIPSKQNSWHLARQLENAKAAL